jgi:hypothetical protein
MEHPLHKWQQGCNGVTVMKSEAYEAISRGDGIESFAGEC